MNKKAFLAVIGGMMVLAALLLVGLAHAANQGLSANGTVWVGTAAGNCDSTGTDTRTAPLKVNTIVFAAGASTDTCILRDGSNTETMLRFTGSQTVSFDGGKTFQKGLYVNYITPGATLFVYPK